jgi:hypothetical protein
LKWHSPVLREALIRLVIFNLVLMALADLAMRTWALFKLPKAPVAATRQLRLAATSELKVSLHDIAAKLAEPPQDCRVETVACSHSRPDDLAAALRAETLDILVMSAAEAARVLGSHCKVIAFEADLSGEPLRRRAQIVRLAEPEKTIASLRTSRRGDMWRSSLLSYQPIRRIAVSRRGDPLGCELALDYFRLRNLPMPEVVEAGSGLRGLEWLKAGKVDSVVMSEDEMFICQPHEQGRLKTFAYTESCYGMVVLAPESTGDDKLRELGLRLSQLPIGSALDERRWWSALDSVVDPLGKPPARVLRNTPANLK